MTLESMHEWMRKRPFEPFRVSTSAGEAYEVRHPEMAMLTRTELLIGVAERRGFPSRYRAVSLLHITAVEPLDSTAAA
jgi:hypothetical protein